MIILQIQRREPFFNLNEPLPQGLLALVWLSTRVGAATSNQGQRSSRALLITAVACAGHLPRLLRLWFSSPFALAPAHPAGHLGTDAGYAPGTLRGALCCPKPSGALC